MTKKKILIVSAYLYHKASPRALRTRELALELVRLGHDVTVLSSIKYKPVAAESAEHFKVIELGDLTWEVPNFGNSKIGLILNAFCRRVSLVLFEYPFIQYFLMVRRVLKNQKGYDFLISIAHPHPIHWGIASIYSKSLAKIWVADCGDPYALLQNDSFKKWIHFHWIEKWFMRRCDYVSVPIANAIPSYFKEFHDKIRVIPQGLSFPNFDSWALGPKNEQVTFAYTGDIFPYQRHALAFFDQLKSINRPFRFIVYSTGLDFFRENMDASLCPFCEFHDPIDRMGLLEELKSVDFLVYFPYRDSSQQPFKLIDYSFLRKPILCFQSDKNSLRVMIEFFDRNFENQAAGVSPLEHQITRVAGLFLELLRCSKDSINSQ